MEESTAKKVVRALFEVDIPQEEFERLGNLLKEVADKHKDADPIELFNHVVSAVRKEFPDRPEFLFVIGWQFGEATLGTTISRIGGIVADIVGIQAVISANNQALREMADNFGGGESD